MHVSYPESAKALPRIFAYLDKQGIRNVPVSELLLATPLPPQTKIPLPNSRKETAAPRKSLHAKRAS